MIGRSHGVAAHLVVLLSASAGCGSGPTCGHDWFGGGTATVSIEWPTGERTTFTAEGVSQATLDDQGDHVDDVDLGEMALRELWMATGEGAAVIGSARAEEPTTVFTAVADVEDLPAGVFDAGGGTPGCEALSPLDPPSYVYAGFERTVDQDGNVEIVALAHIRNGFEPDQAVVWDITPCTSDIDGCSVELELAD
ncbi:MAG: hypothetical protein KC621_10500, partial [Myxococcales bacterium]|nr:hypothetical protein [Myxococcales bacterium]